MRVEGLGLRVKGLGFREPRELCDDVHLEVEDRVEPLQNSAGGLAFVFFFLLELEKRNYFRVTSLLRTK